MSRLRLVRRLTLRTVLRFAALRPGFGPGFGPGLGPGPLLGMICLHFGVTSVCIATLGYRYKNKVCV